MSVSEPSVVPCATADALARSYPGVRAGLKRDILGSALACFNEHGLEPTTIDMIKVHCGTSVGNIYHHFGNKEGVVAALFFIALDDQSRLREHCLASVETAREWVAALVYSYVDWVSAQPELARFQFQARSAVSKGPQAEALAQRNRQRNRQTLEWLALPEHRAGFHDWPAELLPSLIVGQSENYCRAWLSGRVQTSPAEYREQLAEAAWRSVSASR